MIRFKKFSDENLELLLEDAAEAGDLIMADTAEEVVWLVSPDAVEAIGVARVEGELLLNVMLQSGGVIVADSYPQIVEDPAQEDNVYFVDFGGPQEGEWGPA